MKKYPAKTLTTTLRNKSKLPAWRYTLMTVITCIVLFSLMAIPVFATGTVNVTGIHTSILGFGNVLKGFAKPICIFMVIISGLALMTGQQGRQWAKPSMFWAAVGLVVTTFAATLVDSLNTSLVTS